MNNPWGWQERNHERGWGLLALDDGVILGWYGDDTNDDKNSRLLTVIALLGLQVFVLIVALFSVYHANSLFFDRHSWRHRLAGACQLVWLIIGSCCHGVDVGGRTTWFSAKTLYLAYDVILGLLGLNATLSAARDFPHKYIQNAPGQSGTLSCQAMVTHSEMMEHAFYQFLNLCQALYLHCFSTSSDIATRGLGLVFVTAPWWVRRTQFPVNSFSANWTKTPNNNRTHTETYMYFIKKWQYIFYKHVILHGLNITMCLHHVPNHASSEAWRVFWLCLNTSYVMEFFLQSLVRRRILSQTTMLILNRWLMLVSTCAAVNAVLRLVQWHVCFLSLALNYLHRFHDVTNTLALAAVAFYVG